MSYETRAACSPTGSSPKSRLRSFIEDGSPRPRQAVNSGHLRSLGFGASLRSVEVVTALAGLATDLRSLGFGASLRRGSEQMGRSAAHQHLRSLGFGASLRRPSNASPHCSSTPHLRSLGFGASLRKGLPQARGARLRSFIEDGPRTRPAWHRHNLRSLGFGASLRIRRPAPTDTRTTHLRSLGFGASLRSVREDRGHRDPGESLKSRFRSLIEEIFK